MVDNFALLDEPRRPWLDSDSLKSKFLALSAAAHPDRVHNSAESERTEAVRRYADLNAAYNCLREPKERLLHLLELELGGRPKDVQNIPPEAMDLFVEIGKACRDADVFLAEKAKAASPLLKVQIFERGMEWTDRLNQLRRRVDSRRDELLSELKTMNARWESAPAAGSLERAAALPLERLEQLYRAFSYIARWTGQIQERAVQLSF